MYTYKLVTTFKERLTILCEKSNKTDTDIAADLDISKQTLSAWKCGTRSPRRPMIEHIARYFKIPLDWLMGFDVPETYEEYETKKPIPEDELDKRGADLLTKLTPQEWIRLLDYAELLLAARSKESSLPE